MYFSEAISFKARISFAPTPQPLYSGKTPRPLYRCWAHIVETYGPGRTIFMSPCGRTFNQEIAKELKSNYNHLILVCGHYEGIDQRFIDECVDEEISVGDFVLTGGEIPAMAVCDAVCLLGMEIIVILLLML